MGDTVTDRSSSQGLPDDWSRGSQVGRERYYAAETTDDYGTGAAGSQAARTAGPYGTVTARPDSAGNTDPFGAAPADPYGAGKTDAYGARTATTYGAGKADPVGDVDPFWPWNPDPHKAGYADPSAAAATGAYGAETADARPAPPDAEPPAAGIRHPAPRAAADSKGFLSALFDFGFTSFVTPRVIKVLYTLIVIGTVMSALVFTVISFKVSTAFGIVTLIVGDPLFILIVLAIYRIILEFFIVTFQAADDIKALRERGDLR